MISAVKRFNRTVLLACAPFIGLMGWVLCTSFSVELSLGGASSGSPASVPLLSAFAADTSTGLDQAKVTAKDISASIKKVSELYVKTNQSMNAIMTTALAQTNRPAVIYDRRVTRKLGTVADAVTTDKLRAQLFTVRAQNFSGYALKVKLKSPGAMKMAIGKDKAGSAETTLAAVNRTGAVAGINAGGFADSRDGRYPLSTTVLDGKYIGGFEPSYKDLFFVGLSDDLKLIGGKFTSREQLDGLKPRFGASFVPVLRKNGVNLPIPTKWQTDPIRAPRTVIANYKDDQLLILVIDGRDENGSSGATLEEVQILLARFGAIDAYNLDGGGSSSLVFKGRVVNHPSDGQLRPVATNFLFFK